MITVYPFSRRARHYDANNGPDTRPLSRISPNAQARSRSVYIILSSHTPRAPRGVHVCACVCSMSRRYYAANTVSLPREVEQIWGCGGPLNGVCALHHYCTVTRLNPESYKYVAL